MMTPHYFRANKEKIAQKLKQYRQLNKEQIAEKGKEQITCECGSKITKYNKSRHLKTLKHLQFIEKNIE